MSEVIFHVGVELGGTKVIVATSSRGKELKARRRIATTSPTETLAAVRETIVELCGGGTPAGIGVASFGPIDLRPLSSTFGHILSTPKPGWSGAKILEPLTVLPGVPISLDTDVNGAVLGEHMWGAGTGSDVAYITVGTGIGGGIWSDGAIVHGANHSEIGHVRVPRHPQDTFPGSCPYHGDCLEGLASGPAIETRWGRPAESLGDDTKGAVEIEAWYLAHALATMTAVVPVAQAIIGGGVPKMPGFHDAVRAALLGIANGYPPVPFAEGGLDVLAPGLGDDSGVVGALELARHAS